MSGPASHKEVEKNRICCKFSHMLEEHTKYDHLFHNIKSHAVGGIKIFTQNDPYLIEQDYDAVTHEERQICDVCSTGWKIPLINMRPGSISRDCNAWGSPGTDGQTSRPYHPCWNRPAVGY